MFPKGRELKQGATWWLKMVVKSAFVASQFVAIFSTLLMGKYNHSALKSI